MVTDKTSPFPKSARIYVPGSRPDVRVPMREIILAPSRRPDGTLTPNDPFRVYDTSGPWGDTSFHHDVELGLPAIRLPWVLERNDIEAVPGRELKPEDDGYLSWKHAETAQRATSRNRLVQFDRGNRQVYKGKPGQRPTQLAYAKQGIITPEMEYIAIRENQRAKSRRCRVTPSVSNTRVSPSGPLSRKKSPRNSSAPRSPVVAPSFQLTSITLSSSR